MLRFNNKHKNFNERNALIAQSLPKSGSWIMDVGSNTGFTTKMLSEEGHYVLGIEKMEDEFLASRKEETETGAFMRTSVSPQFFKDGPNWDAILLLSVLHRLYAYEGEEFMRAVLHECAEKADHLFIEGSTRHKRYNDLGQPKPSFEDRNIESAGTWHETMFAEVLGDAWEISEKHVLEHTKTEPHRIFYHVKKNRGKGC